MHSHRQVERSPRVTVLMASYNSERFVADSINSVLTQSYSDFEFLIVDDASTDRSPDILRHAARHDARVRVLWNEHNLGLGACLARGVEAARGEYIVRIDADDLCLADRIEQQVRHLDANPDLDVLGSGAIEISPAGKLGRHRRMPATHEKIVDSIWACPIIHPAVAFRRQRILDAGNYDSSLRRRQDYELWFRCVQYGLRFENVPTPLIYYRFDATWHRKQSLRLAIQQARIGLAGCQMLRLAWWQRLGVTVPMWRALLPSATQHLAYRALSRFDPRRK